MRLMLRLLIVGGVVAPLGFENVGASEGGYSNYIPGTYGDFAMAVAPSETWTLRNDTYYYDASASSSVRSGNLEFGTDLRFLMNFTTLVYKPEIEVFGGQFATGVFVPIVDLDLDASLSIGNTFASVR